MKSKIFLLATIATMLFSCSSDDNNNPPSTDTDAVVSTQIDELTDDVSLIAEDQFMAQNNDSGRSMQTATMLPDCATVTIVITSTTWTRTVDFGTEGCEMPNGNVLRGKIIVSGSMNFDTPSYTINYGFENFYHNDRHVEGNRTVVRSLQSTAANQAIHPVANIELGLTVTYPNGNVYTRTGNRIREMIQGFATPMIWQDNVFSVTGNWATTFPNGSQNAVITTPLRIEMTCPRIVSGSIDFTRNNVTATLNYGDGECDNLATVTINGVTTTIILGN